jgi:hypothetical protein
MESLNSSPLSKEEISEQLHAVISEFRRQLFGKTPDIFRQKGSCLRLKKTATKIAELLVEATGQQKLPIDLEPIRKRMLVHTVVEDPNLSAFVSELCPDSCGFEIKIAGKERGIRVRAAIAHEIGHTLFYDTTRLPPIRIFPNTLRTPRMDKQEWISWDFARELLLPRKLVCDTPLPNGLPSAEKMVRYAKKWRVSVAFTCHRIIRDLGLWKNSVMFTFSLRENRMDLPTVRVYRGKAFPRFRLLGREGLVTSSEFARLVGKLQELETLDDCFDWQDTLMWVQFSKYSTSPPRVVGVIELPSLGY